jgi:hypothetical protein
MATWQELQKASSLAADLNELLKVLTPDQRLVVFSDVGEGYCSVCGYERPGAAPCQCHNDE